MSDEMSVDSEASFSSKDHLEFLIDNVSKFRMEGGYTDITIAIEDHKFDCHKIVLAAGSAYFRSMFSSGMEESRQNVVELKQLDGKVFEHVLQFIYTGSVNITGLMVQELFTQAYLFQITPLVELTVQFFQQNMNDNNCLAALTLADLHNHKPLYEFSKKYACAHFSSVVCDEDFMKLSVDCIVDLLRDRRLNCKSEDTVFKAAVKWLEFDPDHRKKCRFKVLECIKYPLITESYLMDVVIKMGHLSEEEKEKDLLDDALMFHLVPSRRDMLNSYQITPRFSFPYFECAVLLGGRVMDGLSNEVECYRSTTNDFISLKTLPFKKRNEFAACTMGNEIYVSGGLRSSEFWKYDPNFETWLKGSNMMHARRRHAMASVDDCIYVLGGFDEEVVLSSIEKWSKKSNTWEEAGSLNTAVENMGFVAFGKKIYLFGGKNSEELVTDTVQCFDTSTGQCEVLKNGLPANDMCLNACVLNSQIYIVGLEGVFRYTPASDKWDILSDMSYPRDFVSLAILDAKLYAFGGRRRGAKDNLYSDVIEYYDPDANQWYITGTLNMNMYSYGCVQILLSHKEPQELNQTPPPSC